MTVLSREREADRVGTMGGQKERQALFIQAKEGLKSARAMIPRERPEVFLRAPRGN